MTELLPRGKSFSVLNDLLAINDTQEKMNRFYFKLLILNFCILSCFTYANTPRNVKLHADSSGNLIALWFIHKAHNNIQTTVLPNGGSWSSVTEFEIPGNDCENPKLAMNSSGNAVLIWSVTDAGVRKIYGTTYSSSTGTWSTATQITQNTETVLDDYDVKLLDNQKMAITWNSLWYQQNITNAQALVGTLGEWGKAQQISN